MDNHKFETKQDYQDALIKLLNPLKRYYAEDCTSINLIATGAGHTRKTIGIEAFLRVLWGVVPLLSGGGDHKHATRLIEGIRNGTNPSHPNYWGEVTDYDQLIVEMAAIGYGLILAPDYFWSALSVEERERLVAWLSQVNKVKAHDCNWLFFAVLVNLGLKQIGVAYSQSTIEINLARIEDFYLAEGWYKDGIDAHIDYYTPFAIHFYSLIYAQVMENEDPERALRYKKRAKKFAQTFVNWFSTEGQAIPYGRSLTYRFSQIAFFTAYIYADVDATDLPWIKGLITSHFQYWFEQPLLNGDGTLSVGYTYPNLTMSENYNGPGSPYWALKSFLILALPDEHPFWQLPVASLPVEAGLHVDQIAEQTIVRSEDLKHVVLFPSGYHHTNYHTHTAAKYEKFSYSTHFAFSVPKSEWTLAQGAFDSMLAVSEQDEYFRVKRQVIEKTYTELYLYMKWQPWPDVTIQTWIIPGLPWHVRIHCIKNNRQIRFADGGYALGTGISATFKQTEVSQAYYLQSATGLVGATSISGAGQSQYLQPNSNTNLVATNTVLPYVGGDLACGEHWLVHGFFGDPNPNGVDQEVPRLIKEKQLLLNNNIIELNFLNSFK
ncbi:DUF2264 domain-containing protein [Amphibacillus marinus]|uniref:DUF2264 domain-containing protein n=1 Tax=Amphibacillus marinus TaxID=872970 RepID=UPI0015A574FC|nr:DUF2264 domain-containing protein [Amphibacillus marinus]